MDTQLVQPKQTFMNLAPEKRESIVRTAAAEFAEQGYQRASLNNIVKQLGISKGSLYQYFDNKEALFLHVFDHFTLQVKQYVKASVTGNGRDDFFGVARQVLLAGIAFIDTHPEYFQVYLKVLFERDVPRREELVSRVRLFSLEYFGPLADRAMLQGMLRRDIPARKVVFILDAMLDRFLQGYAQPHLDGGLALAGMSADRLHDEIDSMVAVLRTGLQPSDMGE
ncbi:MAG: TetR/AcrR family transcriptional regulator [Desulfurivibrionaceae bacterium]|jgi:AcrR family transcriptional regulator|nr:TetR/AcrR family transcriptional regulator [Pseudomonadota bacterium]MBU4413134.1 TetR/AcrR family transcriptional regulator [Pseudomonadota bacterium]MDP2758708.1 TetR/AcrR family transcriptional regulator [Desulfurivibrionaceae bacterium]